MNDRESDRILMHEREGEVRLEYLADDPQEFAAHQARANFYMLVHVVRNYVPGGAVRFSARLTDTPGGADPAFEALLRGRCLTGQTSNTLHFRTSELDVPFPAFNPPWRASTRASSRRSWPPSSGRAPARC